MVQSGKNADIKIGNAMQLKDIPVGTVVHNVELRPGKGGNLPDQQEPMLNFFLRKGNIVTYVCLLER